MIEILARGPCQRVHNYHVDAVPRLLAESQHALKLGPVDRFGGLTSIDEDVDNLPTVADAIRRDLNEHHKVRSILAFAARSRQVLTYGMLARTLAQARLPLTKTTFILRYSRCIRRDLIDLIRADEWWDYKLVPILSAFYATALVLRVPVSSMWTSAVSLLLAVVTAAVYASAVNELTDRADDAAAGKRNRAANGPRSVAALLSVAVCAGLAFAWIWRHDTPLLSCYLATWLAFALYSIPPFRLKKRGLPGVLCDAAGEQMFPALAAVFIACLGAQRTVSGAWVASVAVWALAFGLRGILWHQLKDVENDRAAGVRTFAARRPRAASVLGTFVVFPLELGALAAMLWQIGSAWPAAFLALYTLYAIRSAHRRQLAPAIVMAKPRSFIVLQDFYTDLFAVALLIVASVRDRRDVVILVAHLLLYPRGVAHAIRRLRASTANTVVNASEPHQGGVG
jgi:hypothetical protein